LYFVQSPTVTKKVVGVFVRFSCATSAIRPSVDCVVPIRYLHGHCTATEPPTIGTVPASMMWAADTRRNVCSMAPNFGDQRIDRRRPGSCRWWRKTLWAHRFRSARTVNLPKYGDVFDMPCMVDMLRAFWTLTSNGAGFALRAFGQGSSSAHTVPTYAFPSKVSYLHTESFCAMYTLKGRPYPSQPLSAQRHFGTKKHFRSLSSQNHADRPKFCQ
jgi:hypothetical protein